MSTTPGAKASSSSPSSSFRPSAAVRRSSTLSSRKKRKASPLTKTAQWRQAQAQAKEAHSSEQVDDKDGSSISLNDNNHDTDDDHNHNHNHNGFLTWTYAENKRLLQWLTVWQEDGLDWEKISASLIDRTSAETHQHWKRCDAEYCSLLAKRYGIHADAIRLVSRQWMVRRKQQSQDGKKHYWKIPYRTHNSQDYDRAFISRLDPNVDQTELLRVMNQVSKREAEEWVSNVAATSTTNIDDDEEDMPIPDGLASSPPRRRSPHQPPRTAPDSSSPKPPSTSSPSIRQLLKEGRVRTIKVEFIENDEEEQQAEEGAAISGTTEEEVGASEVQSDGMDNQQGDDEPTSDTQPRTATNESSVSEKPDEAHGNDKEGDTDTVSKTSLPISFRISGKGIRLQASGAQKRGLNSLPSVILDDDCQLLSDYGITIMDQYVTCKSPKLADFVKLDPVQGSTYGLVCRHCMDIDREEGRFNPLSSSHLISMWSDMEKHSETCKELPLEVKEGMFACAHSDEAQTGELPEGSRDQYLERLWQRLEPLQAPEEQPAKLAQDELDEQKEMRGGESDSDESRLGTHGQNELLEVITEVDKQKLPDSLCTVMANVGACWAEEKDAERHTELGIKVGFPGLLCNFCKGVGRKREGRHFFLEKESLRDAEELFRNHFKVCKKTPTKVKREITAALKKKQENTTSAVRKKNNYYSRLWNKLETMRIFEEEDCEIDESESEGEEKSSENEGSSVDSEDGDSEDEDSEDEDEASESQTPRVTQDTSSEEEQGSESENEESDQEDSEDDADEKSEESPKEVRPKRRGRPKKANNSIPKRGRPGKNAVEKAKSAQKPVTKARKRGRPRKVAEPVSDERDDDGDASSEEEDSKTDAKTKNGLTDLDFPDSDQEHEKPQKKSPRSKRSPKTREDLHPPSRRSKRLRKRREKPLMVAFMAQKWKKKAKRS